MIRLKTDSVLLTVPAGWRRAVDGCWSARTNWNGHSGGGRSYISRYLSTVLTHLYVTSKFYFCSITFTRKSSSNIEIADVVQPTLTLYINCIFLFFKTVKTAGVVPSDCGAASCFLVSVSVRKMTKWRRKTTNVSWSFCCAFTGRIPFLRNLGLYTMYIEILKVRNFIVFIK